MKRVRDQLPLSLIRAFIEAIFRHKLLFVAALIVITSLLVPALPLYLIVIFVTWSGALPWLLVHFAIDTANLKLASILYAIWLSPIVPIYVLLTLLARRKSTVLYLRKFGNVEANAIVHRAILRKLRKYHRFIALDDRNLVSTSSRGSSAVVMYITFVFILVLFILGLSILGGIITLSLYLSISPFHSSFYLVTMLQFVSRWFLTEGSMYTALSVVIFFSVHLFRISTRSQISVTTKDRIPHLVLHVCRAASWWRRMPFMHPILSVATVADSIWQSSVSAIVGVCDAVLIDVSRITPNISWELEMLRKRGFHSVIHIANAKELSMVLECPGVLPDPTYFHLKELSKLGQILVYDSHSPLTNKAFTSQLDQALSKIEPDHTSRIERKGVKFQRHMLGDMNLFAVLIYGGTIVLLPTVWYYLSDPIMRLAIPFGVIQEVATWIVGWIVDLPGIR